MSQRASKFILPAVLAAAALAGAHWMTPASAQVPTLSIPSTPAVPSGATAGPPITLVPGTIPATMPTLPAPPTTMPTPPATMPTMPAMPGMPGGSPSAQVTPAVTQPFLASVTGDKVYVRSGPDQKFYEIGQLVKGDLVYVVGLKNGWYQILPPNGSFCMVDKQYVSVDATGKIGTLTGDYVNVHAGSATFKGEPYAILPPSLRKGTTVRVLGTTTASSLTAPTEYVQIAPPEKAYLYISAQFIKAAPATAQYKVPQLKLPGGEAGNNGLHGVTETVTAPAVLPTVAVVNMTPEGPTPLPSGSNTTGTPAATPGPEATTPTTPGMGGAGVATPTPTVTIAPTVTFSETATARFRDANNRYQEECKKPLAQQSLDDLGKEFKDILALENISPSVKAGATADANAIDRTVAVQKLLLEQQVANNQTQQQSDALREQLDAASRAIAAARQAGPYSAEGLLQSSTIVTGKYALVNPKDGRVVAYVDPSTAQVDIGSLMGKYIGVRGMTKRMEGSDVMVIKVDNATLMPQPR